MTSPASDLCPACGRNPPLAPAPFCAACLLAQGGAASPEGEDNGLAPGATVGPYEIVGLLGRGGFAEVYAVRPQALGGVGPVHRVALKVIKRGMDSREILARFRAEQRTVQALSHPGIVRLRGAGFTPDGRPWFAMDQVDGLPVTDFCASAALPRRARLRLFITIAEAVQHAHQKGVLHRDLKPSNILVEETTDGPVPKVIDFGIAKALDPTGSTHTLVTRLGQVLGTPAYMSPEQAEGRDDADTRSDIWSLGAVLYEMLTGCLPYAPEKCQDLPIRAWADHLREHPAPLASACLRSAGGTAAEVRELSGDIDRILRKAMAPRRAERYASAAAFADDVRNWLENRPVSAHPPSALYVLRHFVRRNRWPVAVAVSILGGIVATAGIGGVLAVQARRAEAAALAEKDNALAAEHRAESARERSERRNYQAAIEVAAMHLEQREPYLAAERLRATPARLRGWEWGWLMAAVPSAEAAAESGLANPSALAATPDGGFAAVAEGATLRLVDVPGNRVLAEHVFPGPIRRLALSADARRVAAIVRQVTGDTLHVCRSDGGERWNTPLSLAADLAWEPAGGTLLVAEGSGATPGPGRLVRCDGATGRVLNERSFIRYKVPDRSLLIGRAGRLAVVKKTYKDFDVVSLPGLEVISASVDPTGADEGADHFLLDEVRGRIVFSRGPSVFDGAVGDSVRPVAGELRVADRGSGSSPAPVRRLNWLPDGRWIASAAAAQLVQDGAAQARAALGAIAEQGLDGGRVLVLLPAGRIEIRPEVPPPAASGEQAFFEIDYPEGRGLAFAPDSTFAVFQSWRRRALETVRLGDLAQADLAIPLPPQPAAEWCALPVVCPDGSVLVPFEGGLAVVRPDARGGAPAPVPRTEGAWSAAVGGTVLAVGVSGGVRLLNRASGEIRREWSLPGGPFRVWLLSVGESPVTLALGADHVLHCLPVDGPPASHPMPFHGGGSGDRPAPAAFQAEPPRLAGAVAGGGFAVYEVLSPPAAPRLIARADFVSTVTALAFTPDARRLAVATDDDHRLTIWDWPQGLPLIGFRLKSFCASVAFSPDGHWLGHVDYSPSLMLRRERAEKAGR